MAPLANLRLFVPTIRSQRCQDLGFKFESSQPFGIAGENGLINHGEIFRERRTYCNQKHLKLLPLDSTRTAVDSSILSTCLDVLNQERDSCPDTAMWETGILLPITSAMAT